MINLTSVVMLLQVAIAFLGSSAGTQYQPQAVALANQAIAVARQALIQGNAELMAPMPTVLSPELVTVSSSAPVPNVVPLVQRPMSATLELIDQRYPSSQGWRTKTYIVGDVDKSYVDIGLIVRDGDTSNSHAPGSNSRDNVEVIITATDSSQNKTLQGTGNIRTITVNDTVSYYPFSYEFKTAGDHTITFSSLGETTSITLHSQ